MPLFANSRDASFVRRINREAMQRIVDVEIALYKLSVSETKSNIYGESGKKVYYSPVRLHGVVENNPKSFVNTDMGDIDAINTVRISFLRDDLVDLNLVIELSDIIKYAGEYYQVDAVVMNDYWMGRDPATLIGQVQEEYADTGYSISVVVDAHLTSIANLSIVDTRSGVTQLKKNTIPRNL